MGVLHRSKNKPKHRSEIDNGGTDDNDKGKTTNRLARARTINDSVCCFIAGLILLFALRRDILLLVGCGGGGGEKFEVGSLPEKFEVGLLRSSPTPASSPLVSTELLFSDVAVEKVEQAAAAAAARTKADAITVPPPPTAKAEPATEAQAVDVFPPDCYWECYYDRYDFAKSGMERTKVKAERNYIMHGKQKGRSCKCKFPKECNWECYYDRYPGFAESGMKRTKEQAERNYVLNGARGGRVCTCE